MLASQHLWSAFDMGAIVRTGDGREALSYLQVPLQAGVVLRLSGCAKSWMLVGASADINGIQGTVDGASFCPLIAGQVYFSDDSQQEFTLWVVSATTQIVTFQTTNGVVTVRPPGNLLFSSTGAAIAPRGSATGLPLMPVISGGATGFNATLTATATLDLGSISLATARDNVNFRLRIRCVNAGTITYNLRNTVQGQNLAVFTISMIVGEILDVPFSPAYYDVSQFAAIADIYVLRVAADATAAGQVSGALVKQS